MPGYPPLTLTGVVRHYEWGDTAAIPALLGVPATGEPWAELWFGSHPQASATLADGRSLHDAIEADPGGMLGTSVVNRWGPSLPFLAKVLAAAAPLSIQAHPTKQQAEDGFAREEAAGLDRAAPTRVYRDDNHKPELICALAHFEGLCGFRPLAETRALFAAIGGDGLSEIRDALEASGDEADVLGDVLALTLRASSERVTAMVDDALAGAERIDDEVIRRWLPELADRYPGDPGVIVSLLLQPIVLEAGQAVSLAAGNLHGYLRGVGVEIMATSDNVVRGGLTPKHIDIPELLATVDATPVTDVVQTPGSVHRFALDAPDFALTRVELEGTHELDVSHGPAIVLVTEGSVEADNGIGRVLASSGAAVYLAPSDDPVQLRGSGLLFICTVGDI